MKPETITTFLRALFEPGDVFEIRVLDAVLPNSNWEHTESGYFDYGHIDSVPNAIANFKTYAGVYVTLNPADPALQARANNRFRKAKSRATTSDKNILQRRWLLVDIDPARPAGISATEQERSLAFDKAGEIIDGLSSMGFASPIVVNSGNGTQLLYRVNLPADDGGLIQRCLQALLPCSTEAVHIDISVHNAARISRLPGTWNRKGDSTESRPHRLAEILEIPARIEIVSEELLRNLAGDGNKNIEPANRDNLQNISNRNSQNLEVSDCYHFSPIDDFNSRGDIAPILLAHGWTLKSESDQQYWRRPAKTAGQHSATFDGTVFYVWSDNAEPFESRKGYNRFGVYKLLEHGGDDTAAIESLIAQGFGSDDSDVNLSGILQQVAKNQVTDFAQLPAGVCVESLGKMRANFAGLNPPVVHGLLRQGETMNFIAAPKVGKSWLALRLAISVASGLDWLGFKVEQGRVLHIDNELHRNLITSRYQKVCEAMKLPVSLFESQVDVISLRGELRDITSIGQICAALKDRQYKLVIIDAFYRALPIGTDENDNGAIAGVYNMIDKFAADLGCGFCAYPPFEQRKSGREICHRCRSWCGQSVASS